MSVPNVHSVAHAEAGCAKYAHAPGRAKARRKSLDIPNYSSRFTQTKTRPFFGTTVGAFLPLAIAQPLAGDCGSETFRKYVGFSWRANTLSGPRL
jgi:hypothetical protein